MFKNVMKFAFLLMIGIGMFSTGCTPDEVITPDPVQDPPTLTLKNAGNEITDTFLIEDFSSLQIVDIVAEKGTGALKTLTIDSAGVSIFYADSTLYEINGSPINSNPILIVVDTNSLNWKFKVNTPNDYEAHTYTFTIEDVNGKTATSSVTYRVKQPVITTDLDFNDSGFKFWNNGGPGKGGIDLLTGAEQSASTASADVPHIYDRGPSSGWEHKISPANSEMSPNLNVTLKSVTGVDFNATILKSEIEAAFNGGTEIPQGEKSDEITEGTVFAALVEGTYVLFQFNAIINTGTASTEYYEISIKH